MKTILLVLSILVLAACNNADPYWEFRNCGNFESDISALMPPVVVVGKAEELDYKRVMLKHGHAQYRIYRCELLWKSVEIGDTLKKEPHERHGTLCADRP